LITGGRLIVQSGARLLDQSEPELLNRIAAVLARNQRPDWVDIHQLRAWRAGSLVHIDQHLALPRNLSLEKAHMEAKILENLLVDSFSGNASVLVHMDPCEDGNCPVCGRPHCELRSSEHSSPTFWSRTRLTRNLLRVPTENDQS